MPKRLLNRATRYVAQAETVAICYSAWRNQYGNEFYAAARIVSR